MTSRAKYYRIPMSVPSPRFRSGMPVACSKRIQNSQSLEHATMIPRLRVGEVDPKTI